MPVLKSLMPNVEVQNFSLGGASSLYGCYVLGTESIVDDFDYAIIDFCITDQQMERSAFLTLETIVSAFGSMLSQFKPGGRCTPLVILYPHEQAFRDPRLLKIREVSKRLCQQFNITTIDPLDLVTRANRQYGVDTKSWFLDWCHMLKDHSPAFGRLVADTVKSLPALTSSKITSLFPRYAVTYPDTLPKLERGTSLMKTDTFNLTIGKELHLRLKGYLVGFLHWCNDDTGPLLVDAGRQKIAVPCRKEKKTLDNRFAFTNPATAIKCSGDVRMRIGDDPSYKWMKVFGNRPDFPRDGTEVGFSGLVLADKDPEATGAKAIKFLKRYELHSWEPTEPELAFIEKFAGH
ncbi:hypothetical protein [Rhizobium herbae]